MKALVIWLIILSYGCADQLPESVDEASATCGWTKASDSPHGPAAACLVVTATGSVGVMGEGDDPCFGGPFPVLWVSPGASWASWQRDGGGDFTLQVTPCQ